MRRHLSFALAVCLLTSSFPCFAADEAAPSLTIYNQNFAVVRQEVPLDLKPGTTSVRMTDITMHLEPDSVILRDPSNKRPLQVLEQNYRNDPVSQERLLSLYEGQTIEFSVKNQDGTNRIVNGKVVRSGYISRSGVTNRIGPPFQPTPAGIAPTAAVQPVIEVEGKLQFGLPGQPIFPALGDDTILKPTLDWILYSTQPERFDAELSYISGGLN